MYRSLVKRQAVTISFFFVFVFCFAIILEPCAFHHYLGSDPEGEAALLRPRDFCTCQPYPQRASPEESDRWYDRPRSVRFPVVVVGSWSPRPSYGHRISNDER